MYSKTIIRTLDNIVKQNSTMSEASSAALSSAATSSSTPAGVVQERSEVSASEPSGNENPFIGSVEFWKTWNQRKKKGCKEEGACTCFEGVGSVF